MLKRFVTSKRVAIGAYLSLGAFLLAHTVNAFVADAFAAILHSSFARDSISFRSLTPQHLGHSQMRL